MLHAYVDRDEDRDEGTAGEKVSSARPFVGVVWISWIDWECTSGNTAITLSESLSERSLMERKVDFEGGSSNGELSNRQNAVGNEVCSTLSVETKQDTKTTSYLSLAKQWESITLQLDRSNQAD